MSAARTYTCSDECGKLIGTRLPFAASDRKLYAVIQSAQSHTASYRINLYQCVAYDTEYIGIALFRLRYGKSRTAVILIVHLGHSSARDL